MPARSLTFQCLINAPAPEVYRAFTNATALQEWLCNAAQADPHKGGRLYLWWNSGYYASGEVTTQPPCPAIEIAATTTKPAYAG